jgi:hypothetical protein
MPTAGFYSLLLLQQGPALICAQDDYRRFERIGSEA